MTGSVLDWRVEEIIGFCTFVYTFVLFQINIF